MLQDFEFCRIGEQPALRCYYETRDRAGGFVNYEYFLTAWDRDNEAREKWKEVYAKTKMEQLLNLKRSHFLMAYTPQNPMCIWISCISKTSGSRHSFIYTAANDAELDKALQVLKAWKN